MESHPLSKCLIAGAASTNDDKDIGDDNELTPPLRITIPPLNLATPTHQAAQVKKTSIPLKILFKYPTDKDLPPDRMTYSGEEVFRTWKMRWRLMRFCALTQARIFLRRVTSRFQLCKLTLTESLYTYS